MTKLVLAFIVLTSFNVSAKEYYKFPKPKDPKGRVELGYGDYNNEVDPIYLYEIDGINVGKRTTKVHLTPGEHTLKCRPSFDLNKELSYKMDKGAVFKHTDKNNTVVINIKENKTYYLGFDDKGGDPSKWHCAVYKTEDMKR